MKKVIGFIISTLLITSIGISVTGIDEKNKSNNEHFPVSQEYSNNSDGLFEWPMFRHDPFHTGYSPSLAPEDDNVLWSSYLNEWANSCPAVADNKVYIGAMNASGGSLYCFDAFTGEQLWLFEVHDEFWAGPVIDGDRLYVLCDTYNLYCLDANSGATIWSYPIHGGNCPAIVNNKVYVGNYGGGVYCLNATTGSVLWTFDITTDYQGCSPAVANGKVYIGSGPYNEPGTFYCLDADTGEEIWSYLTTGPGIWSSPCIFNNNVYFATDHLYCLNATTGEEVWTVSGITTSCSPAVAYGNVYIGNDDGKVYCFNATTADPVSISQTLGSKIMSSPAVADEMLYINSNGGSKMVCLDAFTCDIIWDYSISSTYSSPAVAYGNLYIAEGSGNFIVFGTPNEPPNTPIKPDGPDEGETGLEYNFSSKTTDPEVNALFYLFDWGDGTNSCWIGSYHSGETVNASHMWTEPGDFEIRVKGHDRRRESNWSEPHTITIEEVPKPILVVDNITGDLFKVKAEIKNIGSLDASDVNWSLKLDGGAFSGKKTTGSGLNILAGGSKTITSKLIIGFGPTIITAEAWLPEISDTKIQSGFVFLFIINVNPGG